ncbi:MAG: S8 family serine peptidase, partial [Candidatus Saliniplasma sp.]
MKVDKQSATIAVAIVLLVSVMSAGIVISAGSVENDIILVKLEGQSDLNEIQEHGLNIMEQYNDYALIRAGEQATKQLEKQGLNINRLPKRTEVSVKGHRFDVKNGLPDFPEELTIDDYESGEEGVYIVHMVGPVNPEWREKLESRGIEILNYAPNYAYEVRMTPEWAERIEDFDFVDWVDVYQPGFKIDENVEPGVVSIKMVDGGRIISEVEDRSELVEIANDEDVYYISQYDEPELYDEMATQIIGGGLWVMDDDDNPDTAYRADGDYGSYANQIGYDGSGHVTTVADTGLGDGTTPDAGHEDFTGRVVGGYTFTDDDSWEDGHGHGTHCAGSVGGDTHNGRGDLYYEDYYAAQGSAPETELFSVRIFDADGNFVAGEDYREIIDVALQNSDTYVHSNSWGGSGDSAYDDSDEAYDQAVRDGNRDTAENEPVVITVAAGNEGPGAQGGGYETIGSPGVSKNVITIGSNQNYNPDEGTTDPEAISDFSSRGWTEDNRVKPDLVAPGESIYSTAPTTTGDYPYQIMSGTSMATPAAAGAASVVVDWYEQQYGARPNPSMVKALMINTAYDLENTQADTGENSPYIPNQDEGWGMVNLPQIVDAPVDFMLEDETSLLETGQTDEYQIEYQDAGEPLRISLVWTDDEAASGSAETLQNDLNLEVISPSGSVYRGNNLVESWSATGEDTYDTFDDSGDGWDDTNNVENVYIRDTDLEDGTYTVRVNGFDVPADANNDGTANQDYSLVEYNAVEASTDPGPLAPTDPDPADGETGVATDVELSVYAEHEDGDNIDVSFYDASDDSEIGTDNNVASGDRAYAMWEGLNYDTTYDWYAVADDGSQTATSDTWSFTTTAATEPSITLTRPEGGETWSAGDDEEITWDTTAGDGAITGVDLEYTIDDGGTWTEIVAGTEDDGSYMWTVPDESTDQARIRATVNDDNDLSDNDTSGTFTIEGTTPPEITITRPAGGEEWNAGDEEDINWDTTAGDGTITGVDLDYSVDGGASWTNIVTGTEDDGVYTWTVPDEPTNEAVIRGTVHDDNDLNHQNESGQFTILGTPPAPPENLTVEHYGTGGSEELVEDGVFENVTENDSPWTLEELETGGVAEWDDTETYPDDGTGSIYTMAEQSGANVDNAIEEAYWEQEIGPTTEEITVNGAFRKNIATDSQGSGDATVTAAVTTIQVYDTGVGDWVEIYIDEDTADGDSGWIEFGPDATYTPQDEVTDVMAYMYVEAEGDDAPNGQPLTATGELWMDNISVTSATGEGGTEDNLLTWDASPDEPDI